MRQEQFVDRHEALWSEIESDLKAIGNPREGVASVELGRFPQRYRQLCQHLAVARRRAYGAQLVEHLHRLVWAAHQELYTRPRRLGQDLKRFFVIEFPQRTRAEWRLVLFAALLFHGPIVMYSVVLQFYPDFVYTALAPETVQSFEEMYAPERHDRLGRARESETDVMMFGHYVANNTGIGFRTFADGLMCGLGSLFFLLFNGVVLGAVQGHLIQIGYGEQYWSVVAGHSAFEDTAIVLSGASGLRLGLAILAPGRRTRGLALREAGQSAIPVIGGAAAMFFCAAFIEAFWSSIAWIDPLVKYTVGTGLALLVLAYFLCMGRGRAA